MDFDPSKYGPDVARILALDGNGQRLLPLTCEACSSEEARRMLSQFQANELFPGVPRPEAPLAGLFLYYSCFEQAHRLADACHTAEGHLWHAIIHRQEPDSGNAAYWFRRAGAHVSFPELSQAAAAILDRIPTAEFRIGRWDPYAFIAFCERARLQPDSSQERAAREIQRAEWQILFDYCARPQT